MSRQRSEARSSSARRDTAESSTSLEKFFGIDKSIVDALKHIDTFYEAPPPGLVKEQEEERPQDCIPDLPQNQDARDFLAKAPSKGLWVSAAVALLTTTFNQMPLGKEVKVMQCWKCKAYGHRSGDKECPFFYSGNKKAETFRYMHEDPMHAFVQQRKMEKKEERIKQLQALLQSDSSDSEAGSSKKKQKKKKSKKKSKHDIDSASSHKPKKEKKRRKKRSRSRS